MQNMRYQQSYPTQTHHEDGTHSDSEQIYDYHREQISMFLVPMSDIRIPKRKLHAFLDGVVDFVLSVKADDEILDSVLEPVQRMDVGVAEILCERLFLRAFAPDADADAEDGGVVEMPTSENDRGYAAWKARQLRRFYFHGPSLHLLACLLSNQAVVSSEYAPILHGSNSPLATALDKVLVATMYMMDKDKRADMAALEQRSDAVCLYLFVLTK